MFHKKIINLVSIAYKQYKDSINRSLNTVLGSLAYYKEENNMKKRFFVLLNLILGSFSILYAIELEEIPSEYYGTYIPVGFVENIEKTTSYTKALYSNKNKTYHDILFVGKKGIYSDLKFHDGYKITDLRNYKFYKNDSGTFVVDNNKNTYQAIFLGEREMYYLPFEKFVLKTMFKNFKEIKNINVDGASIVINNLKLFFISDLMFFEHSICDAWFYSVDETGRPKDYYALIDKGAELRILKGIKDEEDFEWIPGNEDNYTTLILQKSF